MGNRMSGRAIRVVPLLAAIGLCVLLAFPSRVQSAPQGFVQVKELNFVLLHGMGGTSCTLQLLSDFLEERLPEFTFLYESTYPGTTVRMNVLARCYPAYADIDAWSESIAESIEEHFGGKEGLILVGHSMGGKAALHAVAENTGNLADKVAAVVTINSPIKSLDAYYPAGGGPVIDYCRTILLAFDEGVCSSVVHWDSSQEATQVAGEKHWLAFISAERAPLRPQFDRAGVDTWPRDMDDGVVPISAQYADGADVVYYGQHGHSDFSTEEEVASFLADRILRYCFGESIECSVFARSGDFEHRADWLLGTDRWDDLLGEVVASSGTLSHTNESWTEWREWEDVVGECAPEARRSRSQVTQLSFPFLTRVKELRWLNPDDPSDCRLYIRSTAAPRNSVHVNWDVFRQGLLPEGTERSHYEIEITDGTLLATVTEAAWATDGVRDLRLRVWSEAQSPFRWFQAEWRTYYKEDRQRYVIEEAPTRTMWRDW